MPVKSKSAVKSKPTVKSKSAVKTKPAIKKKSTIKPNEKIDSKRNDFANLAEEILSQASIAVYIVQNGNFVYLSPLFQKLTGYSHTDLLGTNPLDHVHPEDRETVRKNAIKSLKGEGGSYEYRFMRKNGEVMWVLEMVTSITYRGKQVALSSFMDITEHKRTEEALQESQKELQVLMDAAPIGISWADMKGKMLYNNRKFHELFGYTIEDIPNIALWRYVAYPDPAYRETIPSLLGTLTDTQKQGKDAPLIEVTVTCKDGSTRQVLQAGAIVSNRILSIYSDISERRQAEETLRRSEERYRTIIENIEDGYFEVDLTGTFTYVNDAQCRNVGTPREQLLGKNNRAYTNEEEAKRLYQLFSGVYRTGKPVKGFAFEYRARNGAVAFNEMSVSLIKDSEGKPIGFRGITRDITERKQFEEKIRQSEERYRTIIEQMEDGYFETDLSGTFTFANEAECRNLGYTRDELIGMDHRRYADEKTAKALRRLFIEVYKSGAPVKAYDFEITKKNGTKSCDEISVSLVRNSKGEPTGFRGIARNINERRLMEEKIRQSEERYRTIIEEMEEWYFETDLAGNITFFNTVFANVLGYFQQELAGLNFRDFIKKEDSDLVYRLFNQVYKTSKPIKNYPYEFNLPDGNVASAEFSIFPRWDKEGNIVGFRGVGYDVTERKRAEEKIQHMATHDTLTGLPNRLMCSQLLSHAIQSAKRYKRQFAVLFIDLDRFKIINDSLGHEAGDQLLREIAVRLKQTLRAVDVVARLGGDEFVVLIEELNDSSNAATVARKIIASVIKPTTIRGQECRVTASIGICMYPADAEDEQGLMKNADIAMYLAKEEGKNNYQFYSEDIQSKSLARLSIETNLRFALERNELSLHYQAKVDFKTNVINGVEALLRWHNPYLGSVTPNQFIPVAEETGLIVPIGKWVLKTACAQNVSWQQQGLPTVCTAVNLSLRQLMDENLIDDIRAALNDSGLEPGLLELEITESMVMHNATRMIAVLARIKSLGVRLAIDDFGTGYSSLAQIKHFPIDTLKVDRSFIRNIPMDAEDRAITEAIITMGKILSLTVVAEGVETQDQLDFLQEHSCDEMQGYYFSKPIAPEQFADLLRKHVPSPRT
jgi:diguanylate cyclase (GGDEF)-like protein/PAS domain S-box-containing protein